MSANSGGASAQASDGEHLSSKEVSSLPLNARDFSKLLLPAGAMTVANGAANVTQQFAVNGQSGSATVFATDGFDTTDPELGGATFSNFKSMRFKRFRRMRLTLGLASRRQLPVFGQHMLDQHTSAR